MSTPLAEASRTLLMPAWTADVYAWKANDPAETVILGARDPRVDTDDTSFYAMDRAGGLTYLGTTVLGKDAGCQPIVYNDTGEVVLLLCEVPVPMGPGATASLYRVVLQYKLPPAAVGGTGPQGPQGPQGPAGKTILNGTTLPAATTGALGDFYLNTTTAQLYGPNTAAGWGNGVSLVGPRGPVGPQGPAGPGGSGGDDPRVAKFAAMKAIADS